MKEEEAVFGPLLKENFERKELEDMNETVLKQHTLFRYNSYYTLSNNNSHSSQLTNKIKTSPFD